MDTNEGIIDGEADVQQRLDHEAQFGSEAHRAEHATLIARGGIHTRSADADERSPLLGKSQDGAAAEAGQTEPSLADAQEEEWPGQRDFDGVPWWRKPSVCSSVPDAKRMTTDQLADTVDHWTLPALHNRFWRYPSP